MTSSSSPAVLVPREPNEAMLKAGRDAAQSAHAHSVGWPDEALSVWNAMIEAFGSSPKTAIPAPADGQVASQWRPIESAPRDGTEIIVFHREAGVCAAFCPGEQFAWHVMDGCNTYIGPKSGKSLPSLTSFLEPPTHWMPLPAAPNNTSPTDQSSDVSGLVEALEKISAGGPDIGPIGKPTYQHGFDQGCAWSGRIAREALAQAKRDGGAS